MIPNVRRMFYRTAECFEKIYLLFRKYFIIPNVRRMFIEPSSNVSKRCYRKYDIVRKYFLITNVRRMFDRTFVKRFVTKVRSNMRRTFGIKNSYVVFGSMFDTCLTKVRSNIRRTFGLHSFTKRLTKVRSNIHHTFVIIKYLRKVRSNIRRTFG